MTERQIENRVRKLKELESQRKALEEQEKALKAEIKKQGTGRNENQEFCYPLERNHQQLA